MALGPVGVPFLQAIQVQAEDNLARTRAILKLYEDLKRRMPRMTRSQYALQALDWIFRRTIFAGSEFVSKAGILQQPTARRFLGVLREGQVLSEIRPA